jgi:hypothetical protein
MTSSTETALTLVVVKSLAIVGSAFATVLFLAVIGVKRRELGRGSKTLRSQL